MSWDGVTQTVLLDTTRNISSFGEDEAGELFVVGLGGTVEKIVGTTPCAYSISPTSQSFTSAGGTGSVSVTAGTGCAWTAASNASWIHVTWGASSSGDGTVGYSVDANVSSPPRTDAMTIAGRTFTVSQGGVCDYSISPTKANVGAGGGTGSAAVTAPPGFVGTAIVCLTGIFLPCST